MKIISWIKRKLNLCDDCWKEATSHFDLPCMITMITLTVSMRNYKDGFIKQMEEKK